MLSEWVDFEYSVNGKMYQFSIPGGEKIALSDLIEVLGIIDDTNNGEKAAFNSVEDFLKEVANVQFSDESLVKVTPVEGDWELESLQPFNTKESLTITMKNGDVIMVKVTDENLGSYITSMNFYRIGEDGTARKTDTFNDGDHAKVQMNFSIGNNTLTERTLNYQLPVNMQIAEGINTIAKDANGNRVGTFQVDTSGLITLQFDEEYDIKKAFDGVIVFDSQVKNTNGSTDQTVNFTDTISITVKPQEKPKNSDLSITKTGTLNKDTKTISYNVQISTRKGSDGPINFSDWLTTNGVDVTHNLQNGQTITLTKMDENGHTSTVTGTVVKDGTTFRVNNLPALGPNESYSFSYTSSYTNITSSNGYANVSNSARAEDNSNGINATTQQEISQSKINKWASTEGGKIKWTITIGSDGEDLSGYQLSDTMTVNSETVTLPSTIKVNNSNVEVSDWPYTFPAGTTGVVTVVYYTDYDSANPANIHNEVEISKGTEHYSTDVWYKPSETTPPDKYDVTKQAPDKNAPEDEGIKYNDDGQAILTWTAKIEMPLADKDLGQIIYTDKMTSYNGREDPLAGEHYTTIDLLNRSLKVWCDTSGTPLVRGTDYEVYDSDGILVPADSASDEMMTGFTIRFISADKINSDTAISLKYKSIALLDMNTGETWTFANRGKIPSTSSTATFDYTKKGKIDKQTSAEDRYPTTWDDRTYGSDKYHSGVTTIDYKDKTIYYRVVLDTENTEGTYTRSIVVKDQLPAGLKYVNGSLDAWYIQGRNETYQNNGGRYQYNSNDHGTHSLVKTDGNITESYDPVTNILTVTIGQASKDSRYIELYYQATVEDDEYWSVDSNTKKQYTNTVSWGDVFDRETVVVTHEDNLLSKVGAAIEVGETPNTKQAMKYLLTVNPQGLDLIDHADTITVTDTMTLSNQSTIAQFIPTSVKVYEYDKNKTDNKGAEISKTRYQFTYDATKQTIEFTLPDEMPIVVEYQYEFPTVDAINNTTINNSAVISGISKSTTEHEETFHQESGSATTYRHELDIYKVDQGDYSKGLAGAEFKIEKFDKNEKKWVVVSSDSGDTWKVDGSGHLYVNGSDAAGYMPADTLYRITEEVAPPNYIKSDDVYYFAWKSAENSTQSVENYFYIVTGINWWNRPTEGTEREIYDLKDSIRYSPGSLTYYVPNEYTNIDLHKVWLDTDGKELEITNPSVPQSATFTLYRQAKEEYSHTVTVTRYDGINNDVTIDENTPYTSRKTIKVADGSSLTLTVHHGGLNSGQPIIVSDGNSTEQFGENSWSSYGQPGYRPGVITYDSITDDINIIIRRSTGIGYDPELSGYTPPYEYNVVPGTKSTVQTGIVLNKDNGFSFAITEGLNKTVEISGKTYEYYYWLEEENVPSGWTVSYSVDGSSGVRVGNSITVTNRKKEDQHGALKLTKEVTVNGQAPGTSTMADGTYTFTIHSVADGETTTNDKTVTITVEAGVAVSATGGTFDPETKYVTVSNLAEGDYTITETEVAGMTTKVSGGKDSVSNADTNSITVTVKAGETVDAKAQATFTNNKSLIDLTIIKIDETTRSQISQTKLPNAKFKLYRYSVLAGGSTGTYIVYPDDTNSEKTTSGTEGDGYGTLTYESLPDGYYKISEIEPPAGYVKTQNNDFYFDIVNGVITRYDKGYAEISRAEISEETNTVNITYSKSEKTFTVGNNPGAALPNTGGPGTQLFTILGNILILGAGVLLWRRRRVI